VRLIAGRGDRERAPGCEGRCRRFRAHAGRCRRLAAGPCGGCTHADANSNPHANSQSDTNGDQFGSFGRRHGNKSRQQFPRAAWQSGVIRVRPQLAQQSRRRRRIRNNGRTEVSDLDRSLRNLGEGRRAGQFRRRSPPDLGRCCRDQSRTAIDVPLALQSATLDLTQLGFNASVDKGPWTWAVALVHGFGNVNSSRDTGLGLARASYNAHIDGALTELSYFWTKDQSRIVPKAALEYVHAATGSFQEIGGLNPLMATGATVERSRILLGAEVGHYWIFDQKVFDLSAYGKFVDNVEQNFSSVTVSLGPQSITLQGIGESRYGADAGASASLSLSNTARLYMNYDGKFRAAMQSHQGTVGFELKW
jgi:hypothetical protein